MIYLDNAATTPIDKDVAELMIDSIPEYGNPSTIYVQGAYAKKGIETARQSVAEFFNCDNPENIVFTSGATEANNMVFYGMTSYLKHIKKQHIIISAIEHDSVYKSAYRSGSDYSISLVYPDENGVITLDNVKRLVTPDTGLISVMYANNETGVINEVPQIAKFCKQRKIYFHSDCVQAAGILDIDITKIPLDFATISAHKMYGPKGVGALYMNADKVYFMSLIKGGEQENGLRGGTENVIGIKALGLAAQNAKAIMKTPKNESIHNLQLKRLFIDELEKELNEKVTIHGNSLNAPSRQMFISITNTDSETMLLLANRKGVCISAGSACHTGQLEPSRVLKAMNVHKKVALSAIRVSFSKNNNDDEVIRAAKILAECAKQNRSMR